MAKTGMTEKLMTAPGDAITNSRSSGEVVLRTRNLSKQYGKRLAVDNLNLEVHRGQIFGFLGPNGAGKTTTIRMALGLIAPTSGSVEILGQDVFAHRAQVLPRVGALVETPALYTYLSGRNNLRAVASVLGGVPKARLDAVLDSRVEGVVADLHVQALHDPTAKIFVGERLGAPLIRILRENLQRVAAMHDRALDRARQPARHRHVRAQAGHQRPPSVSRVT